MIKPIGVKTLNNYIKNQLVTDPILKNIFVKGEITNLKINRFTYFDLKEDGDLINVVFFEDLSEVLENGQEIIVSGSISIYSSASKYQINAKSFDLYGQGKQALAFQNLKLKLEKKGYFDLERKRPIPTLPLNIGLITSDKSAAVKDFLSILEKNFKLAKIYLYPVKVQGVYSYRDIVNAFNYFNGMKIDVVVITRGGGSNEDLAIFNEEEVCNSINKSLHPVISAIGHEIDHTLSDYCADLRLSTPTKAAEYLANSLTIILEKINLLNQKNELCIKNKFDNITEKLQMLNHVVNSHSPYNKLTNYQLEINNINLSNKSYIDQLIARKEKILQTIRLNIEAIMASKIKNASINITSMSGKYIDQKNIKAGEMYILKTKNDKYKIQVLEKINE